MTHTDNFITQLLNGKCSIEEFNDFTKYYNDKFEILVFNNKMIVKDKRLADRVVIYNNIAIAKANLLLSTAS